MTQCRSRRSSGSRFGSRAQDPRDRLPIPARSFLDQILQLQLLSPSAVNVFLTEANERLPELKDSEAVGQALVHAGLLTGYQLDRIQAGTVHGLILGNYRILERLGAGATGIVFLAEHAFMKRLAAVKVFPVDDDCPPQLLERFYSEIRVQTDQFHPNIATAFDAGRLAPTGPGMPTLLYLVMEVLPGGDLEEYVLEHGPVEVMRACEWVRQAACGLQAAHDKHLVHRDVKPSNLLLTDEGLVKVVDFGLARQFTSRITDPRALLGTIEYMAPEQSRDPSAVGVQADIYGLGATLFWLLTGQPPYPMAATVAKALQALQNERARRVRTLRPDVPPALDELVACLLEPDPARRPALALTVMNSLLPFSLGVQRVEDVTRTPIPTAASRLAPTANRTKRVLVVDDEPACRMLVRAILHQMGLACSEAEDAPSGLTAARQELFDLVLLDLNLPGADGYEVCRKLREAGRPANQKILIVSGQGDQNALAEALPRGADDYVPKPFEIRQLELKVQHALMLKDAQDRVDHLARELLSTNRQLEISLAARVRDVRHAHDALLFTMAKMAESRDGETAGHLRRLQRYTRCLAEELSRDAAWDGLVDAMFLEQLERCVPLHDIGKIGLPDHVLLKPGKLDAAEREQIKLHTSIGDHLLEALGREYGSSLDFLGVAAAVVRHHHERYDGTGYPDGLAGEDIPPAARIVAVADVYDALRRRRAHKTALGHAEAAGIILEESPGQFDPAVVRAFAAREAEFERIYLSEPM